MQGNWPSASTKNNKSLLRGREVRKMKDLLLESSGKTELEFKQLSTVEIRLIKEEIRSAKKKEEQDLFLAYCAAVSVLVFGALGILYFVTL